MKFKYILLAMLCFCMACVSKTYTSTPINRSLSAKVGDTVMKWQILRRERITDQRLVYAGQRNGFTTFKLYTQKPGKGVSTKILNYDLRVSPHVFYKKAEIEVKSATPNSINYIVRNPFGGKQDAF